MRLTLLRSPTYPDPQADWGEHQFTYSLLPHSGGWKQVTVAESYALNDPLIVWTRETKRESHEKTLATSQTSFVKVDLPNVVIETIKQAENGQGLIVRLYESQRKRGEFTLTAGFPLATAWRTNLLEENQERLDCAGNSLACSIKPYQINTIRLLAERNT